MSAHERSMSLVDQLDVVVVPTDRPKQQLDDEGTSSISITITVTVSLTATALQEEAAAY
jgi:hypothetical protein